MSQATKQGDLFGWSPEKGISSGDVNAPQSEKRKPATIEERFEAFHTLNPKVADRMLRLARARLDRGETFISVKALWEELRASLQKSDLAYDGFDTAKLNNSYTALYARLIIKLEPRLASVIELRKRKGE